MTWEMDQKIQSVIIIYIFSKRGKKYGDEILSKLWESN